MKILLDTHVFLLLIAQALQHGLQVATVDDAIRAYPVPLLSL